MKTDKKVIASLPKCYSIAMLNVGGEQSFVVATEKEGDCQRFDLEGNYLETIWSEPGGVMTMIQVPGGNGAFLATHRFYSPNDSKEAKIILAEPVGSDGVTPVKDLSVPHGWNIRTLTDLPFVHRFDILTVGAVHYLIACCLKSDHECKEDWSHPGRIYAGVLPADLSSFGPENHLPLAVIKEGLTKNHGYFRCIMPDGRPGSIVSAEEGVYRVGPPVLPEGEWSVDQLLDSPASDATEIDLDGDGIKELITYAPFHGSELTVWKPVDGKYSEVYRCPEPLDFLHAIWSGILDGKPAALIGHRKGGRDLFTLVYDHEQHTYRLDLIDHDRGPTNVQVYEYKSRANIIATNRETDEVALYTVFPD